VSEPGVIAAGASPCPRHRRAVALLSCIWLVATRRPAARSFHSDQSRNPLPVLLALRERCAARARRTHACRGSGARPCAAYRSLPAGVRGRYVVPALLFAWHQMPGTTSFVSAPDEDSAVEGRAVALSGEMLRVARTTLRISGIEAPADGQVCTSPRARRWRCDETAQAALSRLVRGSASCARSRARRRWHPPRHPRQRQRTSRGLVRSGHVFATEDRSARARARGARCRSAARGDAVRPANHRAQKWRAKAGS
jgi:endonuclease YncB( thermonuclease family)